MAAGQQLQGEAGDAAADVAFGHDKGLHLGRGGPEAGAQTDVLEQHGVDIVEHQQIQIRRFRQTLHAHGGPDGGQELALIHVGQHLILGRDTLHHSGGVRVGNGVDGVFQLRHGQEPQLRPHIPEDGVGIHVGAPHDLVHAGQQTHGAFPEERAGPGGVSEGLSAGQHLRPRAGVDFQHGPVKPLDGAAASRECEG